MKFAFSSLTFVALASSASAAKGGRKSMAKKGMKGGMKGMGQKKSKATRSVSIQANEEYQKHYLVS
jgi:hypothetical protein